MSDRRVREYGIVTANNFNDLVEKVQMLIREGFKDPYIGRWQPQGGPLADDNTYGVTQYHQAMVRTKAVMK